MSSLSCSNICRSTLGELAKVIVIVSSASAQHRALPTILAVIITKKPHPLTITSIRVSLNTYFGSLHRAVQTTAQSVVSRKGAVFIAVVLGGLIQMVPQRCTYSSKSVQIFVRVYRVEK